MSTPDERHQAPKKAPGCPPLKYLCLFRTLNGFIRYESLKRFLRCHHFEQPLSAVQLHNPYVMLYAIVLGHPHHWELAIRLKLHKREIRQQLFRPCLTLEPKSRFGAHQILHDLHQVRMSWVKQRHVRLHGTTPLIQQWVLVSMVQSMMENETRLQSQQMFRHVRTKGFTTIFRARKNGIFRCVFDGLRRRARVVVPWLSGQAADDDYRRSVHGDVAGRRDGASSSVRSLDYGADDLFDAGFVFRAVLFHFGPTFLLFACVASHGHAPGLFAQSHEFGTGFNEGLGMFDGRSFLFHFLEHGVESIGVLAFRLFVALVMVVVVMARFLSVFLRVRDFFGLRCCHALFSCLKIR